MYDLTSVIDLRLMPHTKQHTKQTTKMANNNDDVTDKLRTALLNAPSPPTHIPGNICTENCNACDNRWFEGTIVMFRCQCKELRLCPSCANERAEPVALEHNMADCSYESNSDADSE